MFNPVAARAVQAATMTLIEFPDLLPWSVCDFGNQRYDAEGIVSGTDDVTTTKGFYHALGFESYVALDVNENRDAIVADLNRPVDLGRQFALVVNNGTGEHLFDQAAVFRNMHDLCKPQGLMLNVLPLLPWINHGFFNYTPILFRDLVAANGYAWRFLWLSRRNHPPVEIAWWREDCPAFAEKRPVELRKTIREFGREDIYLIACYQRRNDGAFRIPMQGKYLRDIADQGLRERYR